MVWGWDVGESFCVLLGIKNVPDAWEITKGISRLAGFPKDARFHMDSKYSKFVALPDNVDNLDRMLVVSPRLREFLAARKLPRVEFLPVAIVNHKGKVASADYSVVHPTGIVDCIDKGRSKLKWNKIDTEKISSARNLVIRQEALDWSHPLFRPKHLEYYVMVHPDLAKAIESEKFTGLRFTDLASFMA
jgi:hypothetical protein